MKRNWGVVDARDLSCIYENVRIKRRVIGFLAGFEITCLESRRVLLDGMVA